MAKLTTIARMWLTRSTKPFIFTCDNDEKLLYEDASNLGLYVHVPFCRSLCSFCPYCKEVYDSEKAERYINALKKEIDLVCEGRPEKKKVTSLYFGGGTPALIAGEIGGIIRHLRQHFDISEGIGLELHPRDVTPDKLAELKNAGVTKISIGIQSFQDDFLSLLGREKFDYCAMFDAIRQVPFETVSMDFIFALPGQTFEHLKTDIETAFSNGANHIAVYPFIDFTFADNKFKKMPNKEKKRLLYRLTDYCQKKGYVRDSIWTFAKAGTPKYSSMTRDNFLGFGCSATTLLTQSFKINTFSVDEYIKRVESNTLPTALTIKFTGRQRMIYYLFWTAYTTRVSPADFKAFFGKSLDRHYGFELLLARMFGLIKKRRGTYTMTKRGAYYYHYFENYYTLSYIDKMWGVMRHEAFPEKLLIG